MSTKAFNYVRWGSFIAALIVPFVAWGQYYGWQLSTLTVYQLYPLLGIAAFCIMATHFILAAIRTKKTVHNNKLYSTVTGLTVLGLILLHPGLLYVRLYNDGFGFPPFSSVEYVGRELAIFVMLGSLALVLFIAYEIAEHFVHKPLVKQNWYWILLSQYIAMAAVYVHAYNLGGVTQYSWFGLVWALLGLAVAASAWFVLPAERNKEKYAATHHQNDGSTKDA